MLFFYLTFSSIYICEFNIIEKNGFNHFEQSQIHSNECGQPYLRNQLFWHE